MCIFIDKYIIFEVFEKECFGEIVFQEFIDCMFKVGVFYMRMGFGKYFYGVNFFDGVVDGKEFDYFYDMICFQEVVCVVCCGFQDGNMVGMVIGFICVFNYGYKNFVFKVKVEEECFFGKKKICFVIIEVFVGFDVVGFCIIVKKIFDGKYYIVNGIKKWIINGVFFDYFVIGVNIGKGLLVFFIFCGEGVEIKFIKILYFFVVGIVYIIFDNVKVFVENLLGEENKGIYVIFFNFNYEWWIMVCVIICYMCFVMEECFKWVYQRIVFKKRFIDQFVICQKFVKMIVFCEFYQFWLEIIM